MKTYEELSAEVKELREALQVFVDGESVHDLIPATGMSEEWCEYVIELARGER